MSATLDELKIIDIGEECRREDFDCGIDALNLYLRRYARQNHERNIARSFVAVDGGNRVVGYYSLASASIEFDSLPREQFRRVPRYPIPAARIARLAVDRSMQGKGLGAKLLVDGLKRVLSAARDLGIKVVVVDAKDDVAVGFYRHFEFIPLENQPLTLFLPIETVMQAVEGLSPGAA